jgi:pyruvate dehydrogenase E2 component (dihydrolipoamide acetyltransferase)
MKYKKIRLKPYEKFIKDAFECAIRPDGMGLALVDISEAKRAMDWYKKEKGVGVTFTGLLVKASALALIKHPRFNSILAGYNFVEFEDIDIGVSMAGEYNFAPVWVVRNADRKSLGEISEDLKAGVASIHGEVEKMLKIVDAAAKIIPLTFLRKRIIRRMQGNFERRKKLVGTFQITNPGIYGLDMFISEVISTTALLAVGGIAERPLCVNGRVEARQSVYLDMHVDHRVVDGRMGILFFKAIISLVENPAAILESEGITGFIKQ